MKNILVSLIFLFSFMAHSQEIIEAKREDIYSLGIGDKADQASYRSTDEGFYSIGSPFADPKGDLFFYKSMNGVNNFIKISNSAITTLPYKGNLSDYRESRSRNYNSQSGIVFDLEPLAFNGSSFYEYNFRSKVGSLKGAYYNTYPVPFGALLYSEKEKAGIAIVFDVKDPTEDFTVIDQAHLKSWLPTQPGGFSIGDDGLLYRNGMVWSAVKAEPGYGAEDYVGKLMSGHNIWVGGGNIYFKKKVVISNSLGKIELIMDIPWAPERDGVPHNPYNFGIGPWGEIYALIAPYVTYTSPWPPKGSSAELVVVRNHLKYFGRLNDGGVRLRKEPNTSSEILGTYPAKTGFRIIERNGKEETIAGQKSDWVKVRLLDGKEGWFFGAFVHNLYDGPNGKPPPWPNVPDW